MPLRHGCRRSEVFTGAGADFGYAVNYNRRVLRVGLPAGIVPAAEE